MKKPRKIQAALGFALLALSSGLGTPALAGDLLSDLHIGLGFVAKELCSCLYLSGRPESDCIPYAQVDGIDPKVTIDAEKKLVKTRVYAVLSRQARFDEASGSCLLE